MTDVHSSEQRSANMRAVRGKDTKSELMIRRYLHKSGYRYRLYAADLPGRPDLVFPGRRKIIFVHGCFWHAHANCAKAKIPQTNRDFWEAKIGRNTDRDRKVLEELEGRGWKVMIIWECQVKNEKTRSDIRHFLDD